MTQLTVNNKNFTLVEMSAAEIRSNMDNFEAHTLSISVSLAFQVLCHSNIQAFVDADFAFAKVIDPTIRRFIPVSYDKDTKKWALNKDKADKVREELKLVRGQFDFEQLIEAINTRNADVKAEAETKAATAEAEETAKLEAEAAAKGKTVEQLTAEAAKEKAKAKVRKYMEKRVSDADLTKEELFSAMMESFPEFVGMFQAQVAAIHN